VFKNLVQNALAHGGGQPVTISANVRRTAAGREIVVAVQDRGPGIPDDERPRLFEPFFRGRAAHQAQIRGTGIGLSLVRQAVESHGGRIRISTAAHRGTTFLVSLPCAPSGAAQQTV
jgi:signal transduction histidine kinase